MITKKLNIINNLKPKANWILDDTHSVLREKSTELLEITEEVNDILNKMVSYIDCCYNNEFEKYKIRGGIAVAAPQLGLSKRIIYINFIDEENVQQKYLLANPEIISYSAIKSYIGGGEGCLSVPKDIAGEIPRHYKVIVDAYDLLNDKKIKINATGLLSICLQHEIDHLDGILYYDKIDNKAVSHHRKEWIKI